MLTSCEDTEDADPRDPGNLSQSLDATGGETNDGSHSYENRSAGAVRGERVESNRDTKHCRSSQEGEVDVEACDAIG
jgi:hypothetical protein